MRESENYESIVFSYDFAIFASLHAQTRVCGSRRARNFQIEFLDPGVRAYAFTFG